MSASALALPDRASVEFLKKEARDLHKAFAAGDAEAVERIVTHLPRAERLSLNSSQDELSTFDLSRQETQHALARSYGCAKWEELLDTVRVQDLDALDLLSDRSIQIALREVDQRDLVRVLPTLFESSADRFYRNMSERVQQFIKTEIEMLGEVSVEESTASRDRVREMLIKLGREGWMKWEDVDADRSGPPKIDLSKEPRFVHVGRSLLEVSEEDLATTLFEIAEQARKEGILSLQSLVPAASTLLTEALQYVVDGTEPDLVQDLIETRAATILRHRTTRGQMAIEGWMSIQSSDNPAIVRIKLETYFLDTLNTSPSPHTVEPPVRVDELVDRLQQTPMLQMTSEDWAEIYADMASINRRDGVAALEPLLAVLDDDVLRAGMHATIVEPQEPQQILDIMKASVQDARAQLKRRSAMIIAGMLGTQMGHKPQDIVAAARLSADEQGQKLLDAGFPHPAA